MNREDLEKQEECDLMAHERLTVPRVKMEWLLAKPRSFSNLPAFVDLDGTIFDFWNYKITHPYCSLFLVTKLVKK